MTSVLNVQYNDFDQIVASSIKIIHMVMLQCMNRKMGKLFFHRYIYIYIVILQMLLSKET